MAFNVRIFGHDGLARLKVMTQTQFASDSVYHLKQPYLWAQNIAVSGVAAPSAPNVTIPTGKTQDTTSVIAIEIPDGQAIRYEINPPGNNPRVANTNSPRLTGNNVLEFGPNYTISMIDAAGLP